MPRTKSLSNLLLAGGNSAVSSGMSFKNNMPEAPLPSGRAFSNYYYTGLTNNSRSFDVATPIRNYAPLEWRVNTTTRSSPNKLGVLSTKSSSLEISNSAKGDGSPDAGSVYIYDTSYVYSDTGVTASCIIANDREEGNYDGALNVNAYNTFTIKLVHEPDDHFNDPEFILVDDAKIRPIYFGQGGPFSAPSPPVSMNATYPFSTTFVLFTVAFDGWISADLNYEVQWSLDNFSTIYSGDNTGALIEIGPIGGAGTGLSYTMYARARVTDPYISPWSSANSITFTDPRAP